MVQEVVAELTEPAGEGSGGYARRRRTGVFRSIKMPVYERFRGIRREALPAAYLVPPELVGVAELLRRQGIEAFEPLLGPQEGDQLDLDLLAIEVFVEIEEIGLEQLLIAPEHQ